MRRRRRARVQPGLAPLMLGLCAVSVSAHAQTVALISMDSAGAPGNDASDTPAISFDGRYVAFQTLADNLLPGDTNLMDDTVVRDRVSGEIRLASVHSSGEQTDFPGGDSVAISARGRVVAFTSDAKNLAPVPPPSVSQVHSHDVVSGETARASESAGGQPLSGFGSDQIAISGDGRWVAFTLFSLLANQDSILLKDRSTGALTRGVLGLAGQLPNLGTYAPSLSYSGRYLAFQSRANNLVPADTSLQDVFVRDRLTASNTKVSVSSNGVSGNGESDAPSISGNGRFVVFESAADNLVAGDTGGFRDIFLHDRLTAETVRVSVAGSGEPANADCFEPGVSADGNRVVFQSAADNLVAGDFNGVVDVFLHDRAAGSTVRVSVRAGGSELPRASTGPALSADGRWVAFQTAGAALAGDTNGKSDVYVYGPVAGLSPVAGSAPQGRMP